MLVVGGDAGEDTAAVHTAEETLTTEAAAGREGRAELNSQTWL